MFVQSWPAKSAKSLDMAADQLPQRLSGDHLRYNVKWILFGGLASARLTYLQQSGQFTLRTFCCSSYQTYFLSRFLFDSGFEEAADAEANPNSCIWRVVLALTAACQALESLQGRRAAPQLPPARAKAA